MKTAVMDRFKTIARRIHCPALALAAALAVTPLIFAPAAAQEDDHSAADTPQHEAAPAEWDDARPGRPGGDTLSREDKTDIREKLKNRAETMIIWEVADRLELPVEREEQFTDVMREHFDHRDEIIRETIRLRDEISEQVEEDRPDRSREALEEKLERLKALREEKQNLENRLEDRLEDVLSIEERARFIDALPDATRKVMDRIRKKREELRDRIEDKREKDLADDKPPILENKPDLKEKLENLTPEQKEELKQKLKDKKKMKNKMKD